MKISNSMLRAWQTCPLYWYEKHHRLNPDGSRGREKVRLSPGGTDFGTRMHELLAHRLRILGGKFVADSVRDYPTPKWPEIEDEVQAMLHAYIAYYPQEDFEVLDVERTIEVPLGPHTYVFKCDLWGRKADGNYFVMDHKTESRFSKANLPEAWVAKTQASLYLWACEQYYGVRPDHLVVDILTRASKKGECGPMFRRYQAERTNAQREQAALTLELWANEIAGQAAVKADNTDEWLNYRNDNACVNEMTGWKCDFYQPHVLGESPEHDALYQIAEYRL